MVLARMVSASTPGTPVLQSPRVVVAGWGEGSVNGQRDGIRWDLYPRVNAAPPARAFVLRLHRLSRRPKTVDAYARNLQRFLAWFEEAPAERWIEADEGDLLT